MEKQNFDCSKEYGVVLEGGGAKGAYQIGVWAAMEECQVRIRGVAGVSVGALNGALIAMGDLDRAIRLWENITYSKVMDVDDAQMEALFSGRIKELDFGDIARFGAKLMAERGLDITPLRTLIEEAVDEEKIRNSPVELFLGTFSMDQFRELALSASEMNPGELKDYLLASAYFPAFKNERLHGKKFMDGGVVNNVPVDMLVKRGYQDILVIRIYGIGLNRPVRIPDGVNVTEIAPKADLGGILEFNPAKIRRNIKLGYYDGLRLFRSLRGKIYYVDVRQGEEECMLRLLHCHRSVKMALMEYYGEPYDNSDIYTRRFFEKICPELAEELKLEKNWTYGELYLSLLELCAKTLRISKYHVYTDVELEDIISEKYTLWKIKHPDLKFPMFIELVLRMITLPAGGRTADENRTVTAVLGIMT